MSRFLPKSILRINRSCTKCPTIDGWLLLSVLPLGYSNKFGYECKRCHLEWCWNCSKSLENKCPRCGDEWVHKTFRYLDEICADLRRWGIEGEASLNARWEPPAGQHSFGVVTVRQGPVEWVNRSTVINEEGEGPTYLNFGIPDSRLSHQLAEFNVKSFEVRKSPLVGRVINFSWKGNDLGLGIVERLLGDEEVNSSMLPGVGYRGDVYIRATEGAWTISTLERRIEPKLWTCFQSIARQLLNTPDSTLSTRFSLVDNNRGNTYLNLGERLRAIEDYDEAIRLSPQHADAYYNRGIAYADLGEYQLAIDDLNETLILDPQYADAFANKALTYTFLGKSLEAQQNTELAIGMGVDRGVLEVAIQEAQRNRVPQVKSRCSHCYELLHPRAQFCSGCKLAVVYKPKN